MQHDSCVSAGLGETLPPYLASLCANFVAVAPPENRNIQHGNLWIVLRDASAKTR